MTIVRRHPALLHRSDERFSVAVVIDVLRATSTATVLFGRGMKSLTVAGTVDDLRRLPPDDYLIFSELAIPAELGASLDNSPSLASRAPLDGRHVVLVTTNGTRALLAASDRASTVLTASFLNVSAVAHHIARLAPPDVVLVPSGSFEPAAEHAEDERCADGVAALLSESPASLKSPVSTDLAALAARGRADARVQDRLAREPGLAADLDLAFSPDRYAVVMAFCATSPGLGRLTACTATS